MSPAAGYRVNSQRAPAVADPAEADPAAADLAEADPAMDVDGTDAAQKASILSALAFNTLIILTLLAPVLSATFNSLSCCNMLYPLNSFLQYV